MLLLVINIVWKLRLYSYWLLVVNYIHWPILNFTIIHGSKIDDDMVDNIILYVAICQY